VPIAPVFQLGAAGGETVPFWNQNDEFGAPNMLVVKPEEGDSLARALGPHNAVLLNNHGACVVGRDLRELVSRSIFMCQNAEYQLKAHLLGKVVRLTPGETRLASTLNALPNVTNRTWEYWTLRLDQAGGMPPVAPQPPRRDPSPKRAPSRTKAVSRKGASKKVKGRR
jgi:HCOMODA/2-hydroxy-3-carboxy-muconic semialdehyde decarboxylase